MIDILLYIFFIWLGYQIGTSWTMFQLSRIFVKLKTNGIKMENVIEVDTKVRECIVEEFNETLYLYDNKHNEFICQGKNMEELAELALKYKKVAYAAVLYNDKVYSFIDGKIQNT